MTSPLILADAGRGARAPQTGWRKRTHAVLAATVVAMGLGIGEATAMADIQCEIRSRPGAMGLELTGVLWSEREITGDYSFIVDAQGPGGVSRTAQRGHFTIKAGGSQILGTVTVNAATGGNLLARLSISTDNGTVCASEI